MKKVALLSIIIHFSLRALAQSSVLEGQNEFAVSFFKAAQVQDRNFVFSPSSLHESLTVVSAGAKDLTQKQMYQVLNLPKNYLREYFQIQVPTQGKHYELYSGNRLWLKYGHKLNADYLAILKDNFNSELKTIEIKKKPEVARKEINKWIEDQTNKKFKNFLGPQSLGADSQLVITNAMYFKSKWSLPFKRYETKKDSFHVTKSDVRSVDFMYQTEEFGYAEASEFQVLEMLYEGNEISFFAFLPLGQKNLSELEKNLTGNKITSLMEKVTKKRINVVFPKFKIETSHYMNEPLKKMGLAAPFNPTEANFGDIAESKEKIFLSLMVQKILIDVNENGTEIPVPKSADITTADSIEEFDEKMKEFRADRPFLFAIRHNLTNRILFFGRVSQPGLQ